MKPTNTPNLTDPNLYLNSNSTMYSGYPWLVWYTMYSFISSGEMADSLEAKTEWNLAPLIHICRCSKPKRGIGSGGRRMLCFGRRPPGAAPPSGARC